MYRVRRFAIVTVLAAILLLSDHARVLAHWTQINSADWGDRGPGALKKLAEKLVSQLGAQCDPVRESNLLRRKALLPDAELILVLPASVLPSVIRNGFLNQHLTGTSRGYREASLRFATEQALLGRRLPYGYAAKSLLPKYAVLNIRRPGYASFPEVPRRYGEVLVKFRAEVLRRATWTDRDALIALKLDEKLVPRPVANPIDWPASLAGFFPARTLGFREGPTPSFACGTGRSDFGYCEAQIWGPLLWDDVQSVAVPQGFAPLEARALSGWGRDVHEWHPAPGARQSLAYRFSRRIAKGDRRRGAPGYVPSAVDERLERLRRWTELPDERLLREGEEDPERSAWAELLSRNTPAAKALAHRLRVQASSPAPLRSLAVLALAGDPSERERIESALSDADEQTRLNALSVLVSHAESLSALETEPAVRALAQDASPEVRTLYRRVFASRAPCP